MFIIIISLFQLSVVGLPVEGVEEPTYEEMGETPHRPSSRRAGRFNLEPAKLSFADELEDTLRRRGRTPAIPDSPAVISPLVNLLVSFCTSKILFQSALPLVNSLRYSILSRFWY